MNLFEIDSALQQCFDAETGEILNPESLEALSMEREQKIENIALWIKDLEAEAQALKAEKQAFEERQKAAERKAASLKKYLLSALGGENFKTIKAAVTFRKSQKVEVPDVYKLNENFVRYSEPTADKAAIKKAIQAGQTVEGATLVESLSISVK
jgi:hypothetical protein